MKSGNKSKRTRPVASVSAFALIVMLAVSLPVMGADYNEAIKVDANGNLRPLDTGQPLNLRIDTELNGVNLVNDLAGKQPLDSDLSSISILSTTSYGRGFLTQSSGAAGRNYIGALPTGSVSERGLTKDIWVSARTDLGGPGTAEDPIKVTTSAAFQTVLDNAPADAIIRLAPGTYPAINVTISKNVTITGNRSVILTQATGVNKPIFRLTGVDTEFTLSGISLVHGTGFREEDNKSGIQAEGGKKLRVTNIFTSDFTNTIRVTGPPYVPSFLEELIVENSDFVYTYGRAGCSDTAPYTHPSASIVGNPKRLIVRNNTWDGLLDPTFAGISGNPPASTQVASDNFIQTGNHDFADVSGNVIINHYIEGIRVSRTAGNEGEVHSYSIKYNHITGVTYARGDAYYAPAIVTDNCQAIISGNTITNTPMGVNTNFESYDEDNNVVQVVNNTMSHVIWGINASNTSSKSQFNFNTIRNTSEPVRTVWGPMARPQDFFGIRIPRGSVVRNVLIADEPVWDASPTLSSRASNVFILSSVTGIVANTGAFYAYMDNALAYFPVEGISGNNVTVNSGWAANYPTVTSGTIYYTESVASIRQAGGIIVENGGVIYAEDNTIIGHRHDLAQLNSGSIVSRNTTARGCHVVQPNSATFSRIDYLQLNSNLNNHTGQAYYVDRFNDTSQPANKKILDLVFDAGAFFGRTLNDDLTIRMIPFNFSESLAYFSGSIQAGASGNITAGGNIQAGGTGSVTGYSISAETTVAGDGSLLTNLDARRVSANTRDVADTNTTLTTDDYIVRYTTLTAARVVTLPSAASANGVFFIIKDRAGTATANPITFAAAVEGSTAAISTNYGVVRVQSDGTVWYRL